MKKVQTEPEHDSHPRSERERLYLEAMMRVLDRDAPGGAVAERANQGPVRGAHGNRVLDPHGALPLRLHVELQISRLY